MLKLSRPSFLTFLRKYPIKSEMEGSIERAGCDNFSYRSCYFFLNVRPSSTFYRDVRIFLFIQFFFQLFFRLHVLCSSASSLF